jgi:hypothetical protein
MTKWIAAVVVVLSSSLFLPAPAQAQALLVQRCNNDLRPSNEAERRLDWARRCALLVNIRTPPPWQCSSTATNDYYENSGDWSGRNKYTGQSDGINAWHVSYLYISGATSEQMDPDGYCKWSRVSARKKARPLYPVYGSQADLASPSNLQLFPHPNLADCRLYLDKNGTQPATGYDFYVNGYCEAYSSMLTNATPLSMLSGTTGSMRYFTLNVPPGTTQVTFETSGGTGDVDLYVQYNSYPTLTSYACRPLRSGNTETCTIYNPTAGNWHVLLHGWADYSGVTLVGRY